MFYNRIMPAKNIIKDYLQGGYYHIYNRGVNKNDIFKNKADYFMFLHLLKEYLLPPNHPDTETIRGLNPFRHPINCYDDITLLAYSLMPNHYHLFLQQKSESGLINFMKALATSYAMYFNQKYDRVGHLFQGAYKGVLIKNETYLLHISRYIHANPREILPKNQPLENYSYSSYQSYLGEWKTDWLNTEIILSYFKKKIRGKNSYQEFVEEFNAKKDGEEIREFILE